MMFGASATHRIAAHDKVGVRKVRQESPRDEFLLDDSAHSLRVSLRRNEGLEATYRGRLVHVSEEE
jgi:hypothetical protein